eukprot:TRINITY_DN42817_c0_g1_i1.p1 TRINITY_DN42817_c0_g1~~TRINITY_DN42817_c0_g1_i1.p1  ORF type:complete len:384 (+),score=70.15 TRINITY_DN42817_c0_g1_i1:45-1154(+)
MARPVASDHGRASQPEVAVAAVEKLAYSMLKAIAAGAVGQQGETASLLLTKACNGIVQEDGAFCARTDRQHRLGITREKATGQHQRRRLTRLFAVLDAVHRLNTRKRKATQRELFYRLVSEGDGSLFKAQSDMEKALQDAIGALRIGRPQLGVLVAEKGLVAGEVVFHAAPGQALCSSAARGVSGSAISEAMLQGMDYKVQVNSLAQCVLVVEKDSFFQHLLQSGFLAVVPVVLVTGRGYPDLLTRRFLQLLHRLAPGLPQLYLGDYDPDGVAIFLLYHASCPQLRWLGLHLSDVQGLPTEASLSLTARDRSLQASLLCRPEVKNNSSWSHQVQAMSCKFELEALHAVCGEEGVARKFLPEKLVRRSWL